jgi:NAD(P)-dependent dehydrogenase (short-subunit alcohol dehydrogenase family)
MRVLVVGASGILGQAVVSALAGHEIIEASRDGDHKVDLRDAASIAALYFEVGQVDAVACAAGVTPFRPFRDLTLDDFRSGLDDKLVGQIELVRQGIDHVADGGSFTLISGILVTEPIETGAVASTVNGAVEAFVRAAATGLPRGQRINAVSANAFTETWDGYADYFPVSFRCLLQTRVARTRSRSAACRPGRFIGSGTDATAMPCSAPM